MTTKTVLLAVFGVLLVLGYQNFSYTQASAHKHGFAKGRILMQPAAGISDGQLNQVLAPHGGKSQGKIHQINVHVVSVPAGAEEAVAEALSHNPQVKFAEVDQIVSLSATPNDPYTGNAWHIPLIGVPAALDVADGSGITIAILDTGTDCTHPDLAANCVAGWNFYDNNSNTSDVHGHGTETAGAAAASTNNGVGVAAVSGQSKIMPIRIADSSGTAYYSTISQGVTYAADHGARVASISFAGVAESSAIINAASYMKSKNGLVVVSAGNSGTEYTYAQTTALIPVSATDNYDSKASWSSYGSYVALSAPGVGIWTTTVGGGYGAVSGTSFSSPITAGVVALMMSANPTLSNTQIEKLLFSTSVDLGNPGRDIYYGYGRVDAAAAVIAAKSAATPSDSQSPSVSISSPTGGSVLKGLATVSVSANDNVGVARVDLYAGGNLIASDNSSPYSFSLDTSTIADGSLSLVARAYDAAGNVGTSSMVNVSVSNTVDISAPSAPTNLVAALSTVTSGHGKNAKTTTVVKISWTASTDNVGITKYNVYRSVNGVATVLVTSVAGSTLSYQDNSTVAGNSYSYSVKALDAANNISSESNTASVGR